MMHFTRKKTGQIQRVLLLADTHAQIDPRIVAAAAGVDLVVHAGDIGCLRVLHDLAATGSEVAAVRGNNDTPAKWPVDEHSKLVALPWQLEIELSGGVLCVVHGHCHGSVKKRHTTLRESFPHARAIVYGHSHRLGCDTDQRPWVLNPGAAGRSRTFGGPSYIVLSASARTWRLRSVRLAPRADRHDPHAEAGSRL